ncbi:MAG: acylphosphatase [Synechococcaceae cyanobacterium]|nr:acylphosphatase [Synechococcaceae cyanobacterium]
MSGEPPRERWRIDVRGRVQGVGYRAACQQRAIALGLGGWVRNRPDGAVELEAEGPPARLEELLAWCEQGPPAARVDGVRAARVPVTGCDWFEIRR